MLLLHDSLGYTSAAHFQRAGYTVLSGTLSLGLPHERLRATSLSAANISTPQVGNSSSPVCVLGFLATRSALAAYGTFPLLDVIGSSGTQIRATLESSAEGLRLRFYRGVSEDLLLTVPPFPPSIWVFVEIKIVIGSSGSIEVKIDGSSQAKVEQADTEAFLGANWNRVSLFLASPVFVSVADLYLCDGRQDHGSRFCSFLGKITHSKLPQGEQQKMEWSPRPMGSQKFVLSILAGQSNMTGRTVSTSSPNWRNPNPKIWIWNRLAGVPAFQDLSSTVNSASTFLPANVPVSGPEMRFAERLAAFYEAAGDASTPFHVIVKGVQDGSYLYPTTPDYTWDINTPGGLYGRLQSLISNAVAGLGGWSYVDRVDFFWFQGENDAIFTDPTVAYEYNLRIFLGSVIADIGVHNPNVSTHVIRIHKDLKKASAPNTPGFYYKDQIRRIQDRICGIVEKDLEPLGWNLRFRTIDIDQATIASDEVHLQESGYDLVGDRMFDSWLSTQSYQGYLSDYDTLPDIDDIWLGAGSTGRECLFRPASAYDSTNNPVLAVSVRHHSAALVGGLAWSSKAAGVTVAQNLHSSITLPWYGVFVTSPVAVLPESLSLDLGMST